MKNLLVNRTLAVKKNLNFVSRLESRMDALSSRIFPVGVSYGASGLRDAREMLERCCVTIRPTYAQRTLKYAAVLVLLCMAGIGNVWADYTVMFKTGSTVTEVTTKTDIINSGGDYVSSVSASKTYKESDGLRYGTGSAMGYTTFTMTSSGTYVGQIKASKITFLGAKYYSSDNSSLAYTITYTDNSTTTGTVSLTSTATNKEVSLTSTKMIKSVDIRKTTDSNKRFYCKGFTISAADSGESGTCDVFFETFAESNKTGGNDDTWSGISGAASDISADNTGWSFTKGYAANGCARFGTKNDDGSATTPSITVSNGSSYTLSFKAAPWGSDNSTMTIALTGGNINNNASVTTATMTGSQWNSYEYTIVATANTLSLNFNASENRFFLDEICISSVIADDCEDDPTVGVAQLNGPFNSGHFGQTLFKFFIMSKST